ncbi:MAG TPA: hypothetical protein ENJ31_13105 [Anaerolineae bacterium]|nr:hypothetical protein [Anaerolineae bacterium]
MSMQILDRTLEEQIRDVARREQIQPVEVIARAVRLYQQQARSQRPSAFLLSIAGLGASGEGDVAERDEEILAAEVDRRGGWSLSVEEQE